MIPHQYLAAATIRKGVLDGVDHKLRDDQANRHLERLGLAHKVQVRDGTFTTTDLSTGQRKRLALVMPSWMIG